MNITIFTPTYNRANTLRCLYDSLCEQIDKSFEWIIIDDGSTDNTKDLVQEWVSSPFNIRYYKSVHGGKQRAINQAVALAKYDFFFIVDSDDTLCKNAISLIISWINEIICNSDIVGVSGLRVKKNGDYINGKPSFGRNIYLELTNIERARYNLQSDMAEVYRTDILKRYPFPVWEDETFTPECVVWDRIALDGYKLRWYNAPIYICEYLEDGLTKGGYKLYSSNLMGCAMANSIKLEYAKDFSTIYKLIIEVLVSCILKKEWKFLLKVKYPILHIILAPVGILYAIRRRQLIRKYS